MVQELPPLRDWQVFEDLCRDLFERLWKTTGSAMKNGRQGQPQAGVDIFGMIDGGAAWAGAQCKKRSGPLGRPELGDPAYDRALYAALAIRESDLWQRPGRADKSKLERIRLWLRRTVEQGALDPKDRAEAGLILGMLGDDRPGVGLRADGLPDIEWVEIPAGTFVMGDHDEECGGGRHAVTLSAFAIARYPVTNRQFEAFVDLGGYEDREFWSEEGWEWKEKENLDGRGILADQRVGPISVAMKSLPLPKRFLGPNQPRVGVSWFEASAYCRWLSGKLDREVLLPTEAQWEKAARGMDGRTFPWGNQADPSLCNMRDTGLASTSAVGLFPDGASPAGSNEKRTLDASGNVFEWCSDGAQHFLLLGVYPEWLRTDPSAPPLGPYRVIRGGSWDSDAREVRAACRLGYRPGNRRGNFGFRLARN